LFKSARTHQKGIHTKSCPGISSAGWPGLCSGRILVAVLDEALLADWCGRYHGTRPAYVLFRSGHLSQVTAAELSDGRQVVIKARPFALRIAGCIAVQAHITQAGSPCPVPLTALTRVSGLAVTAETLVPGDSQLPAAGGVAPFAALLARPVGSAPIPAVVPALAPSPPWAGWDHPGPGRGRTATTGAATSTRSPGLRGSMTPSAGLGTAERFHRSGVHWPRRLGISEHPVDRRPACGRARPGQCHRPARAGHRGPGRRRMAGRRWTGARSRTPGRPACGSACSPPRRTRLTAVDRNSTASQPR
jgi:hypothetical protein